MTRARSSVLALTFLIVSLGACQARSGGDDADSPAQEREGAGVQSAAAAEAPAQKQSSGAGGILASAVQRADLEPNLVVVYSASSYGYLEPCGCLARGTEMGGVARRATVVDSLRASGVPVLLLEAGDFVGGSGLGGQAIGDVSLRVMEAMGYDALTLGEAELALGEAFLKRVAAGGVPLAHTNYSHPSIGAPQHEGLLIEKAGRRIGVIGVLDPARLPASLVVENLVVEPVAPAVTAATSSLRAAGAELVIVLGHADFRASGRIAQEISASATAVPDLWVVGHGGKELSEPPNLGGTLLLGAGNVGKFVGILRLNLADGATAEFANEVRPLPLTLPESPAISRIVETLDPSYMPTEEPPQESAAS